MFRIHQWYRKNLGLAAVAWQFLPPAPRHRAALMPLASLLALLFLCAGPEQEANAGPIFTVSAGMSSSGQPGVSSSGSAPVTVAQDYFSGVDELGNFTTGNVFGNARPGHLGVSAHTNMYYPDAGPNPVLSLQFPGEASATFSIDDVIISGPRGISVPASLNLHVDGFASANAIFMGGGGFAYARARLDVDGNIAGNVFSGFIDAAIGPDSAGQPGGVAPTTTGGIFADFTGNDILTTAIFNLPVGTPISFSLSAHATANSARGVEEGLAGSPHRRFAEAESAFGNSISFPISGPVFNFPDGYTANSLDGLIVDNRWTGGVTAVPEPSSLTLLVLGGFTLLGLAWRQRNVHQHQITLYSMFTRFSRPAGLE